LSPSLLFGIHYWFLLEFNSINARDDCKTYMCLHQFFYIVNSTMDTALQTKILHNCSTIDEICWRELKSFAFISVNSVNSLFMKNWNRLQISHHIIIRFVRGDFYSFLLLWSSIFDFFPRCRTFNIVDSKTSKLASPCFVDDS
jgi:hypothetical protein